MASLLSLGLRKIRQPKVIAEVLGGILLGLLFISTYMRDV
jgi:Kef-type K+ transport system membrane component KefB